jgi:L-fuculose-phosphate aldolase
MMTEDQLIIIDPEGRRIDTPTPANRHLQPTSEITMHLEVYKQRADVQAVVHAHPPHAIALSIADMSLAECMLPEAIFFLGIVQTTPYATPSSPENAAAIRQVIRNHDAIVLQRHGSLTTGSGPLDAFFKTETLEQVARVTYMLKLLGAGGPLAADQVEKLMAQRRAKGVDLPGEAEEFCRYCGVCHPQHEGCARPPANSPEALVELITQQVLQKLGQNS